MMGKRKKSRFWWWLVLFLVFAGLIAYFILAEMGKGPKRESLPEEPGKTTPAVSSKEGQPLREEQALPSGVTAPVPPVHEERAKEDPCDRLGRDLREFFHYLDQRPYVKEMNLQKDTLTVFKGVLERLEDNAPVPAGEALDPTILARNVFHFYRTLDRESIRLIKGVLLHEADTSEFHLQLFYRWFTTEEACPRVGLNRPSSRVVYQYAGYLLNTLGGRAYLYRRPPGLRILLTYYSLSVVHAADKEGKNTYGIDIYPLILPLMEEINRYADFQFHAEYVRTLTEMEAYYVKKREPGRGGY